MPHVGSRAGAAMVLVLSIASCGGATVHLDVDVSPELTSTSPSTTASQATTTSPAAPNALDSNWAEPFPEAGISSDELGDLLEVEITTVEPSTFDIQDNPDPRGPCGARIEDPPTDRFTVMTMTEGSWPLFLHGAFRSERSIEWAQIVLDDLTDGCPAFESETPYGGPQTNRLDTSWRFEDIGDQAFGFVTWIKGPDASDEFPNTWLTVTQDDAVSTMVIMGVDLPEVWAAAIAELMGDKLAEALG